MLHYVKMFACMFGGHVRFDCNGILIKTVPSTDGIKSRKGCGFQTHEVDSADDNERCESAGFCKNVCMHVWGHVRFDCNGILIETSRLSDGIKSRKGCGFPNS